MWFDYATNYFQQVQRREIFIRVDLQGENNKREKCYKITTGKTIKSIFCSEKQTTFIFLIATNFLQHVYVYLCVCVHVNFLAVTACVHALCLFLCRAVKNKDNFSRVIRSEPRVRLSF